MKCPFCGFDAEPIYYEEKREGDWHIDKKIENVGYCTLCNELFTVHSHSQPSGEKMQ